MTMNKNNYSLWELAARAESFARNRTDRAQVLYTLKQFIKFVRYNHDNEVIVPHSMKKLNKHKNNSKGGGWLDEWHDK